MQSIGGERAGRRLGGKCNRILEIKYDDVGAAGQRLGDFALAVSGDKKKRTHGSRRLLAHEDLAAALRHQCAVLLESLVLELNYAGIEAGATFALGGY